MTDDEYFAWRETNTRLWIKRRERQAVQTAFYRRLTITPEELQRDMTMAMASLDGLTVSEIASILGISKNFVGRIVREELQSLPAWWRVTWRLGWMLTTRSARKHRSIRSALQQKREMFATQIGNQ